MFSTSTPLSIRPPLQPISPIQLALASATNAINAEYAATAQETDAYGTNVQALLGSAISGVQSYTGISGAYVEYFHYNGAIYWSYATGAHVVVGGIGAEYTQTANEFNSYGATIQSTLGLPTSDETGIAGYAGGRMNTFQYGVIDWSGATGAHAVIGGIFSQYSSMGGATSWLGLPTNDESGSSTFRSQGFESGTIQWSSATGASVSAPPISITSRYGDELAVTATGVRDSITISQSGILTTITADGQSWTQATPSAGIFVYTRGGTDTIVVDSDVSALTTVECIDSAPTTVTAFGSDVITWADTTDSVHGGSIHTVSSFAGGVSKAVGASLADPSDIGSAGGVTRAVGSLFGTGPAISDINQGHQGDCYLLASWASVANQNPNIILNSAVDMGDGTYVVEFHNGSTPTFVRVNADVPADPSWNYNGYCDANPGPDGSIWGPIMEKAYAEFAGNNTYASIGNGGHSWTAMNALGAINTDMLSNALPDNQLAAQITSDLTYHVAVTVSTNATTTRLVADHCYSIVGVETINGVNEYVLRNPYGEWDNLPGESSAGLITVNYAALIMDTNWIVQASFT